MALHVRDLWEWDRKIGRRDYFLWGLLLAAIKYNIDRLVIVIWTGRGWFPFEYFRAPNSLSGDRVDGLSLPQVITLLALAMPFVACGVQLTLRRLRDVGWPAALTVLFFVPFVNLIFFAILSVQPGADRPRQPERDNLPVWKRALVGRSQLTCALLSIGMSVLLGVGLSLLGTLFLRKYGWGLFVGIPFMMGFFSALFYGAVSPKSWIQCTLAGMMSLLLVGAILFALAMEGIVCLAMAAPIGMLLAFMGSTVGWLVTRQKSAGEGRLYAFSWLLLPALMVAEAKVQLPVSPYSVATEVDIGAPPAVVWRHVIEFSDLPPPREWIFAAGIAYPVRARLDGRGVGAVRHCAFSTGAFVEPITAWDESERLAFDVTSQPPPLEEWSFYSQVHPPHLDGFFRSKRGEFRLMAQDNGHTLLRGTTWYEQDFWPQPYWRVWSDYLVHLIHGRVLAQIKSEAESAWQPPSPQ